MHKQSPSWEELRGLGAAWWLKNTASLKVLHCFFDHLLKPAFCFPLKSVMLYFVADLRWEVGKGCLPTESGPDGRFSLLYGTEEEERSHSSVQGIIVFIGSLVITFGFLQFTVLIDCRLSVTREWPNSSWTTSVIRTGRKWRWRTRSFSCRSSASLTQLLSSCWQIASRTPFRYCLFFSK